MKENLSLYSTGQNINLLFKPGAGEPMKQKNWFFLMGTLCIIFFFYTAGWAMLISEFDIVYALSLAVVTILLFATGLLFFMFAASISQAEFKQEQKEKERAKYQKMLAENETYYQKMQKVQ